MKNRNYFGFVCTVVTISSLIVSCRNSDNTTNSPADNSKKEIWAEQARSVTYFKVDTLSEADQPWGSISKSMDKKKIVKTLFDAAISGKAKAYDVFFNPDSVLQPDAIKKMIISLDTVQMEDPSTGKMSPKPIRNEITADNVTYIAFTEDWYFDAEKFSMEKKVTRACLYISSFDEKGDFRGYKPLFWVGLN
jgi:hypothetical protein